MMSTQFSRNFGHPICFSKSEVRNHQIPSSQFLDQIAQGKIKLSESNDTKWIHDNYLSIAKQFIRSRIDLQALISKIGINQTFGLLIECYLKSTESKIAPDLFGYLLEKLACDYQDDYLSLDFPKLSFCSKNIENELLEQLTGRVKIEENSYGNLALISYLALISLIGIGVINTCCHFIQNGKNPLDSNISFNNSFVPIHNSNNKIIKDTSSKIGDCPNLDIFGKRLEESCNRFGTEIFGEALDSDRKLSNDSDVPLPSFKVANACLSTKFIYEMANKLLQPTKRESYIGNYYTNEYGLNSVHDLSKTSSMIDLKDIPNSIIRLQNEFSRNNLYGVHGSEYSPYSVKNSYGQYGNKYSSTSIINPYATDTPKLYDQYGNFRGKLSANIYDPDSISNPYGRYGSKYSFESINNPFGAGNSYRQM